MKWYHILLMIVIIILVLLFILTYICYKMTFYSKNIIYLKNKNLNDDIYIPNDEIHNEYKIEIIQDVKEVRKYAYQKFSITSFDNLTLVGKYYEYKKDAPIEIMFHGYTGSAELDLSTGVKRAHICKRNVLLVDQRASGESEGKTITFGINERHDCISWINFVINEFGEDVKIIITGVSMGAATVLMASGMNLPKQVIGVLADCGYNTPKDIIVKVVKDMKLPPKLVYPFIRLSARIFGDFNLEEYSPIEAVKTTNIPIFFVHGECDDFVPHEMSLKMFNACNSRKVLVTIPKGKHGTSYLANKELYITELNKFFK